LGSDPPVTGGCQTQVRSGSVPAMVLHRSGDHAERIGPGGRLRPAGAEQQRDIRGGKRELELTDVVVSFSAIVATINATNNTLICF